MGVLVATVAVGDTITDGIVVVVVVEAVAAAAAEAEEVKEEVPRAVDDERLFGVLTTFADVPERLFEDGEAERTPDVDQ